MEPLIRRVLGLLAGGAAVLLVAELALRGLRGDAHVALPIYASLRPLTLLPNVHAVGLFGGRPYTVDLDARGRRVPSRDGATVLVGDSVAFGLGLDAPDTLAARCAERGRPLQVAAAPGFSLADALERAESFGGGSFLVIVNAYDDDAPTLREVATLAGPWLVRRESPGPLRAALGGSLGESVLVHDLLGALVLLHPSPETRLGSAHVAALLADFVARHPGTLVAWARPEAGGGLERTSPAIELDLPAGSWLADGVHWSAMGTERVADRLCGG